MPETVCRFESCPRHYFMEDIETKIFVGQKAFINRGGKLLVLRDPEYMVGNQKGLDLPGGRFRWGDDPIRELLREVDEETGLKVKVGKPFITWTNIDHMKKEPNQIFYVGYDCKYLSGEVRLSDEHNQYEWVDSKSYTKWKENNGTYRAISEYFRALSSVG